MFYRVTWQNGKNLPLTWIWDVPPSCQGSRYSSCSSGPPTDGTIRTKSTGGFYYSVQDILSLILLVTPYNAPLEL